VNQDLTETHEEWPLFGAEARAAGFNTVHALPLRLRGNTLGAINLFQSEVDVLTPADIAAGQALADVATIAILHHRAAQEAQILNDQLNYALSSSMDGAFAQLRNHARNHNLRLVDVARDVTAGTMSPSDLDRLSTSE
jgi:GAF domain-containing protein